MLKIFSREDVVKKILSEILERIRPDERELEEARRIYEILREELRPYFEDVNASIQLHGSIEKGTALKGDLDLDVFILIPKELGKEWIRREFIKRARKALSKYHVEERYAEHPYLRIKIDDKFEADVVPGLKIDDPRETETAVDRTPFHTQYIKKMLREDQRDEVRLLKRFMKGVGVYGAEVKIGGFSGYVAELLIVKYGSFIKVIEEAAENWREPVIITLTNEDPKVLKRFFQGSSFILPDPVDPKRNAGAAVRSETLARFILAARAFLKDPSENFFFPEKPDMKIIMRNAEKICFKVFELDLVKEESPDNVWGQLLRIKRRIYNVLDSEGYDPVYIDVFWDEKSKPLIYLELPTEYCVKGYLYKVVEGPPIYSHEAMRFIEKQLSQDEGFWIKDNRLYGFRRKSLDNVLRIVRENSNIGVLRCCNPIDPKDLFTRSFDEEYVLWLGETILKIPRYMNRSFQTSPITM